MLAIEGKVDFVKRTNPFGSSDDKKGKGKGKKSEKKGTDDNIIDIFSKLAKSGKESNNNNKPHTIEKQQ